MYENHAVQLLINGTLIPKNGFGITQLCPTPFRLSSKPPDTASVDSDTVPTIYPTFVEVSRKLSSTSTDSFSTDSLSQFNRNLIVKILMSLYCVFAKHTETYRIGHRGKSDAFLPFIRSKTSKAWVQLGAFIDTPSVVKVLRYHFAGFGVDFQLFLAELKVSRARKDLAKI